MSRHEEKYQMIYSTFIAFFFFISLVSFPQSINRNNVVTVHVCRQDSLSFETSLYLAPGYHELTMQSGETSPMASFRAEVGQQYWFRSNYEHIVSETSSRDLSVSLTMLPKGPDADRCSGGGNGAR
jgi:hypothetical protein